MNIAPQQFLPFMYAFAAAIVILVVLWQLTKRHIPLLGSIFFYLAILVGLLLLATPIVVFILRVARVLFGQYQPHIYFYVLSLFILVCASQVAMRKNLVHAALFLCLTFLGVAGIFIMLNAEFLAAVQILIYAGAVTVLMLFAIMLTQNLTGEELKSHNRQVPFVVLGVGALAIVMIICFLRPVTVPDGQVFSTSDKWAVQAGLEEMAIEVPNISLIGESLMSTYTLAFWIVSIVLTIAMIGGLILARKD